MLPGIPPTLVDLYKPLSFWESFYLRTRWRLCPFQLVEAYIPKAGRILDFGCGYGMLSNYLALTSPDREVLGIDLNAGRIRAAIRSVKNRKNIEFRCGDVRELKLTSFSAVVMTDVLHHMDDRSVSLLLTRVRECLHREGTLLILDVDSRPLWKFLVTYAIDRFLNFGSPLYYRSRPRMQALLEASLLPAHAIVSADQGLPLSDVIYLCRKEKTSHTELASASVA
jgi:2-polyprenyl-6-hydroxyphenyl methylase/3-demethylubiquinone-9 3-methyltransferase